MTSSLFELLVAAKNNTGCSAKRYTLLFYEFLGFLGVEKFDIGHFFVAFSVKFLKMSGLLLFGKYLAKYSDEVILKLEHTGSITIRQDHSGSLKSTY